jgi:putative Holliday junction resolvase
LKIIALDVGDKTIGVAVSDDLLLTGQGVTTIHRVGIRKDTGKIIDMIREYKADTVIIGLPRRLDGTDSPQTEKVYEFRQMLENKLLSLGMSKDVQVDYQDERLTTVMAERVLIEADLSRKRRKEVIDKQAAVLILQGYLDKLAFQRRNT